LARAEVDDGSQNLVGAITTCMGNVGASNIAEFQQTEIIIAPSIKTEGKFSRPCRASAWERVEHLTIQPFNEQRPQSCNYRPSVLSHRSEMIPHFTADFANRSRGVEGLDSADAAFAFKPNFKRSEIHFRPVDQHRGR